MKKIKSIACFVACVTALSSVMTYAPSANAESEMVYGTMNIPYSDLATGYNKPLEFTVKAVAQTTTTTAVTTTAQSTTTAKTTTTAKKTSSSPVTGDNGAAIPAMMLALAGISAFIFKKKHK